MRAITTYNENIYNFSAHKLVASIREFLPECEVVEYDESSVQQIPEFTNVLSANKDVIPITEGGEANKVPSPEGWQFNSRWFNWFKKVAVQYDCIKRNKYNGYSLFFDADIRVIKEFTEAEINQTKPVGVFQGDRRIAETGFLILNETNSAVIEFYDKLMEFYLSGEFREYGRWDDSFSITMIKNRNPHLVQDLAENIKSGEFTNSNKHTTALQIIPFTKWGKYIEHDKGIHCRNKIL